LQSRAKLNPIFHRDLIRRVRGGGMRT
jgi:hypothetical protein